MRSIMLLALLAQATAEVRPRPVVCRAVSEAKGKTGEDLAVAVETLAVRFAKADYVLAALLPGDPPIACFRATAESRQPPR